MSRPAPLDHDFNKEKFADLLVSARGNNTQAKFADTIPMSPTYLSSYIRCRFAHSSTHIHGARGGYQVLVPIAHHHYSLNSPPCICH